MTGTWIKVSAAANVLGMSKRRVLEYAQSGVIESFKQRDPDTRQVTTMVSADGVERMRAERENPRPVEPGCVGRVASSTSKLRREVGDAAGWVCIYCQRAGDDEIGPDGRVWHVDHFFAESKGGDSLSDNLVLACATCNLSKNHKLASEVLDLRRQVLRQALAV